MRSYLIVLFMVFSFSVYAAENATFAVRGEKIYSPTLTGSYLIYIIAPDRLAGWSGQIMQHEIDHIPKKYQKLPILGGWNRGQPIDKELIKKEKITKAFVLGDPDKLSERIDELKSFGMDVLVIKANTLEDYFSLFRELGKQMGITNRGNALAAFGEEILNKTRTMTKDIPDSDKKYVYVGSGSEGLSAACSLDSMAIAGGKHIYDCPAGTELKVSLEQVAELDPEIIIITNPVARKVMDDPEWHRLTAYKDGKLYIAPFGPFGWLHHFTPYTSLIGTPWLACKLYPDKCNIDIEKEAKKYYKLFLNTSLSDKQLIQILYR